MNGEIRKNIAALLNKLDESGLRFSDLITPTIAAIELLVKIGNSSKKAVDSGVVEIGKKEAAEQNRRALDGILPAVRAIAEDPGRMLNDLVHRIRAIAESKYATTYMVCGDFSKMAFAFNQVCRHFLDTTAVKPGRSLPILDTLYREFEYVLHVIRSANTIAYFFEKKMGACRTPYARSAVTSLRFALETVLSLLRSEEIKLIFKEISRMRFRHVYFQLDKSVRLFVRARRQLRKNFKKLNTYLAKIEQDWKI